MQQYVVKTPTLYIGQLKMKKGDIFSVDKEGIHFQGNTETRSNVNSALRFNFVEEYVGQEIEVPVEDTSTNPNAPTSSKYKVDKIDTRTIDQNFSNPADRGDTTQSSPEKNVSTSRASYPTHADHKDLGTPDQVRKTAQINQFQEGDNYIIEQGVRIEKPKPFRPGKVRPLEGDIPLDVSSRQDQQETQSQQETSSTFVWDTSRHWKTRVKEAREMKESNPALFQQILNVESDTVLQHLK